MSEPQPAGEAPDWNSLTTELLCPRCGYNLRLLPQPRCPECGLEFVWEDLIAEAETRLESPLFEHQWRRRPFRSFVTTVVLAAFPWWLWRRVPLTADLRLIPLLFLALVVLLAHFGARYAADFASNAHFRWWIQLAFGRGTASPPFDFTEHVGFVMGHFAFALLTWLVLQVFQQTIARFRVRPAHFLRLIVLAWVALLTWHLACDVSWTAFHIILLPVGVSPRWSLWSAEPFLIHVVPYGLFVLSVCLALNVYLKLRRGWLMGASSVVIVMLALAAPLPLLTVIFGGPHHFWDDLLAHLWPGLRVVFHRLLGV